jgi:hypothetical protein
VVQVHPGPPSSPVNTRAFTLYPFRGSPSKKEFANYLPTFGTTKYLNRKLPVTVTGSGCASLKPEWGEVCPRTRACRGTSADAGYSMDQFGINRVDTGPTDRLPVAASRRRGHGIEWTFYGVQPPPNAWKEGFAIHIAMHNSVVYDALAVPSVLSHVVESTCGPLTLTAAV